MGWATARVAPTERFVGADDPVRPMWVCNIFVGQGPCALPWVRGKNPPVTASPCQPPLGKGAKGTGVRIATGALRPRNDRFLHGVRCKRAVGDAGPYGCVTRSADGRADVGIGPYEVFTDRIS